MRPLTTPSPPPTARWHINWRPTHTRRALRMLLGVIGWALLVPMLLLIAYLIGLIVLAAVLLGRGTVLDEGAIVFIVLLALSGSLIWLLGRSVARPRTVAWIVGAILAAVAVAQTTWALTSPDRALYVARQVAWGDSRVTDYQLFPARAIANAPPVFRFQSRPAPELLQPIIYQSAGQTKQLGFEEFLKATQTTSFIVIKDDAILYEGYFNGYSRDSIVTSFSMAKSFTSALVGIAIDEGYIGSVNDPVITYLPELRGRGLDDLTIRHLLTMSSGIRYIHDDAISPLQDLTQFTDDGLSYSYPNLRSQALQLQPDGEPVGTYFNYNNYYPQLLGMILERTTKRPVAEYLQEKIWKPLGMEYPASWSLDSEASGFELMTAGINGRAIDFAKFGRLFLNNGAWNGKQIVPAAWVVESTSPDSNDMRPWRSERSENVWVERNGYYKYLWWGKRNVDGSYTYEAHGKRGQRIAVSPSAGVVVVRFGTDMGGVDAWEDVIASVVAKAKEASNNQASQALSEARQTLTRYLTALSEGRYEAAAQFYGGSYEQLIDFNTSLDSSNKPGLLKAACTINGFQCLKVSTIKDGNTVSPTEFTFLVEFVAAAGQLHTFYPPPGAAGEPRSQFTFIVTRLRDNSMVLEVPPYVS